jgi:hypothetical protein
MNAFGLRAVAGSRPRFESMEILSFAVVLLSTFSWSRAEAQQDQASPNQSQRVQIQIDLFNKGDESARVGACEALAQLSMSLSANSSDRRRVESILFHAINEDASARVRFGSARALLRAVGKAASSDEVMMRDVAMLTLGKSLKDPDPLVRLPAAKDLGAVGPLTKNIVPNVVSDLVAAFRASGGTEREQLGDALRRIDPAAARRYGAEGAPLPTPAAVSTAQPPQRGQAGFDLRDRAITDTYLNGIINKWKDVTREPNPLVKQKAMASLRGELDDLNKQYKGKVVRWRFKTRLLSSPPAVVAEAPSNFLFSAPGVSYGVTSSDRVDDLRGMILGGATQSLVPPRLVVGQNISEEEFLKLRGGEEFLVEGTIQELRYPSLELMRISLMIDVYICRARIVAGPF